MQISLFHVSVSASIPSRSFYDLRIAGSSDYDERGVIRLPTPESTANLLLNRTQQWYSQGRRTAGRDIHMNSLFLTYIISQKQMFMCTIRIPMLGSELPRQSLLTMGRVIHRSVAISSLGCCFKPFLGQASASSRMQKLKMSNSNLIRTL